MVGQLVDVGGFRLYLHCVGTGATTVVFDSGALDSSVQWDGVQPVIAKTMRSCSFDRAGIGWSDPSPADHPSFSENANDLHKLLSKADIAPPFLLVGHSNGGLDMQTYAHRYPDEVAGIVLVDSVDADEIVQFPERFVTPAWGRLALKFTVPLGIPRFLGWCNHSAACPDCSKFTTTMVGQLAHYAEIENEVRTSEKFGAIPLFVLAHDPAIGLGGQRDDAFEQAWSNWQKDLAARSSDSKLEVVQGAGHEIQTEHPERVVDAIQWVMKQTETKNPTMMGGVDHN
jgi:pimeloyl-ACP methyl ester carboxylesterase